MIGTRMWSEETEEAGREGERRIFHASVESIGSGGEKILFS